jgi:hypothetical protein
MYGYGFEGSGYRYPKRRRKVSVETYIGDEKDQEAWAKAAIYNKAIANQNPWIKHLRESGTYDKIRKALLDARLTYNPTNVESRKKSLQRRMTHIGQEVQVIGKEYPDLMKDYEYDLPYNEAKNKAIAKLIREANMLKLNYGIELPKGIPQLSLEELFPGKEGEKYRKHYSKML